MILQDDIHTKFGNGIGCLADNILMEKIQPSTFENYAIYTTTTITTTTTYTNYID